MPKAMLVADAEWVVNEVSGALAVGDWDLDVVEDSRTVADLVEERRPDAVIVDFQVGSMGGMAVIRAIRQEIDPAHRPRTILLLDRLADRFIAKRAGADAYVEKPILSSSLRAALAPRSAAAVVATEEE